ncbi:MULTISPECIES: restriction endonuclease subunit S [Campylobacterales]|uniref:restriction endonuclease subunit S n=1 Tax=Campylobacterales TaxID=213849 RepID=UPI003CFD2557
MGKLEKYTSYKESGAEWLGEIPEHWETLSNKNIFKIKQKLVGKKSSEYDLLSLTIKGIIKRDMENPQGKFPAEFNTYQEVNQGDFVFCLFDVEETPRTVGLSQFDGMITGAYTVMTTKGIDKDYLYYFYLNLDSSKRFKPLYRGLRNTIPKDSFFSFKTFIPPKEEQTKIASFLDEKTSQIDNAISQKEKLIELLKECRQITINEAVTKGLDKNVEFKDSDVEWIGEIPKHWEVIKFKHLFYEKKKAHNINLNCGSISFGKVVKKDDEKVPLSTKASYQVLNKGEFLINPLNLNYDLKSLRIGLSDFDVVVSSGYIVIKNRIDLDKNYFNWLLHRYDIAFMKTLGAGVRQTLNYRDIGETLLVNPPKEEQGKIAEYIETQTAKIDKAIELQQNYISKLKEYKASLIDSVVTGKVRVV